jgi:cytochrome c-type biogenesis protein CcmE
VLEGHWQGATFQSDLIMVKHSEQYKAKHPDRVQGSPTSK